MEERKMGHIIAWMRIKGWVSSSDMLIVKDRIYEKVSNWK